MAWAVFTRPDDGSLIANPELDEQIFRRTPGLARRDGLATTVRMMSTGVVDRGDVLPGDHRSATAG